MVTLRMEGGVVPEYGAAVTKDGDDVGIVRSPCQSPSFDMEVIGLSIVDRALAVPGTRVEVACGDGTVGATVAPVPLYDTKKTRPRA